MNKNYLTITLLIFLIVTLFLLPQNHISAQTTTLPRLGVWINVFSAEKVLFSKEKADTLIDICSRCGIKDVYLQIYRSDKAYYNSDITDNSPYLARTSEAKEDLIKYLIKKGKENDIKLHAWVNLLSIAQNSDANILKKYGQNVLTRDQYGRTSMQKGNKDELDKYYIRENQLFLEPGDTRVRSYLVNITYEIIAKYPGFSGLHLDYIRYPAAVPFIPGSKFTSHGISYGYTKANTDGFRANSGVNIKNPSHTRSDYYLWDEWRRKNVTKLLKEISTKVKTLSPELQISCSFVPSIERTYLTLFQDWTEWLREGYADYIVAMNYTEDSEYMKIRSESVLVSDIADKIHIGLGAYLMKNAPGKFKTQIKSLKKIAPSGIAIYTYDNIAASKDLQNFLRIEFNCRPETINRRP